MPRIFAFSAISVLIFATAVLANKMARDDEPPLIPRIHHGRYLDLPKSAQTDGPARVASAVDTFVLGEYSFDDLFGPDPQGWLGRERYEDVVTDTFFHVADATELTGGDIGRLIVLEGTQSLWCGALQSSTGDLCYYATLPGYGNNWEQRFTSVKFPHTGDVELTFLAIWDSEPAEDRTYLEFLNKDDYWEELAYYDYMPAGSPAQLESFVIPNASLGDSVQIRFWFHSDGAWSDEDGRWPTDGAIVIDSLRLADANGLIDFQDFETESVGARVTNDGHWYASRPATSGNFSGLFPGLSVLQEDGCVENASGLWGFFDGSTDNYSCGGHPEQLAVPLGVPSSYWPSDFVSNEIQSPLIEWDRDIHDVPIPGTAGTAILEFDVYRDLPLANLVFYRWFVRSVIGGCPQKWRTNNYVYYGDQADWYRHRANIGGYVEPGAEQVQVALTALDQCGAWCGYYGDVTCHSHAPLFDNVRLTRIDMAGPSWDVQSSYLFQDNFATDGTLTGTVAMDGAIVDGGGLPRDDVTVFVPSASGIDSHIPGDSNSGPAVYCHVKDVSPAKSGSVVSGDLGKYPWIETADDWTTLQCYTSSSDLQGPSFSIDLNDALYQPGDTVFYYFSARDTNGVTSYWSAPVGATLSEPDTRVTPTEVTCLPANALDGATDILYVDGFDGYGAQPYFETAFDLLGLSPDRYDILGPSLLHGSGPGIRVVDVVQQLASVYRTIIWNTGHFRKPPINDGVPWNSQPTSDDFGLLNEFLDKSPNRPGIYLSGDNLASWWISRTGTGAVNMRNTYMNFNVLGSAHTDLGEEASPIVVGLPGSCFDRGPGGLDMLIAYGSGCLGLNDFDVLQPFGAATSAMAYPADPAFAAIVTQITQNSVGDTARVVLSGFSFHQIRDLETGSPPVRSWHLEAILNWLQNDTNEPTGVVGGIPFKNSLAQNSPNPFNPSTTIRYTIKQTGHVTLKIYDVAGRLVRTLVDEEQSPMTSGYATTWNGQSDQGTHISSGVYFYRLTAGGQTYTKKMVLLK